MKNKLLNKIISVILVSLIGLSSISSFNHVSADELDNFSSNSQLISSGSNIHMVPFLPPTNPGDGNPLTRWIGTLSSLGVVLGMVVGVNVGNTVKVLENAFADQKTATTFNNIINNSPNFNINDFANDPDNLNGNYQGLYNKYGSKLNVDTYTLEDLENYNKNLYYNGGNKNYYTNNDYSSNDNYSVFNSSTNNINYTYNNQHYNYTVNNMFYNYVTNEYTFNTTNNQNITYINNYNNTTIINPSGATQKLYYELPDGSNSLNLTEEQANKGFKTSLNVASYSNGYDDDNLNFLFHFDGNEYDSAYPIVNYILKAIPNSVDYIDSSNPSFNQAIAFSDSFDLSVEGANYKYYYSFRIYPQINNKWSLIINGVDIASRISKIDTKYDYVEWPQQTTTAYWHMVTVVGSSGNNSCPSGWSDFGASFDNQRKLFTRTCGYKISNTSDTTQRTYNIINNKLFEDSGSNLLNYNQWNFISIDTSGKVFINGVDTNITVPLDQFKISVTGDSLTYIDELASFKTNRSNTSPSIPYDSNVSYYLPPVYYEDVYTPIELSNGYMLCNYPFGREDLRFDYPFSSNISFNFMYSIYEYGHWIITSFSPYEFVFSESRNSIRFFDFYSNRFDFFFSNTSSNDIYNFDFVFSDSKVFFNGLIKDVPYSFNSSGFYLQYGNAIYLASPFKFTIDNVEHIYYPSISPSGEYGFYDPNYNDFIKTNNLVYTQKFNVSNVKKSEIKNNMLLIQSLVPINSSKFGGIRPSNPNTGDVYCSVNENGNITSVQQYNGIEWVKVVGSIYNDALGLWVNAVGFNIFLDNWSYQDIDYRADNPDTNILIRFLTSQFNKVTGLLDSIIEKIKGISSDETVINNYQNNYNVDINTNIDNLINTSKDYDNDIDLNSPNYNVDDSMLTDINNLAVGSKGIFKALDDSGFSILYLAPLILLLVGLLL